MRRVLVAPADAREVVVHAEEGERLEVGGRRGEPVAAQRLGLAEQVGCLEERAHLGLANELHAEARGLVPPLDEVPSTALYLTSVGNALRAHGRLDDAKQAYAESLELWRSVGRDWGIAEVLTGLGDLAQAQGDADHALAYYRESLTLHVKLGNKLGIATCFAGLAQGASTKGQPEQVAGALLARASTPAELTDLRRVVRTWTERAWDNEPLRRVLVVLDAVPIADPTQRRERSRVVAVELSSVIRPLGEGVPRVTLRDTGAGHLVADQA